MSMMSQTSAMKLVTVIATIQPPQKLVGRSATRSLVLERNARCGIQVRAGRAQRDPHDHDDHERGDDHVADEDNPGHGGVTPAPARPRDCRYAMSASSSVRPTSAGGASSMSFAE